MAAQDQETIGATSTRDAIRWGLLLASIAVAGFRLPRAFRDLRAWREFRFSDPSAASFYWTSFQVSVIGIAIIVCVASAAFYLLKRSSTTAMMLGFVILTLAEVMDACGRASMSAS